MNDFELYRFLVSLATLLLFALVLGQIFDKFKMPRVIGEITAGLLLGPSVLGTLAPQVHSWLFHAYSDQIKTLSVLYWLGLIFLMFSAGFKISTAFRKEDFVLLLSLIGSGVVIPGAFGFLVAGMFPAHAAAEPMAFALVLAVGAAVTSIPVISKIYTDLFMDRSRFARVTLTAAAIQDLLLWTVLSIALAIQQRGVADVPELTRIVTATICFSVFTLLFAPRFVSFAGKLVVQGAPQASLIGYTVATCLLFVTLASAVHVNVVIAALLAGMVVGKFRSKQMENVRVAISGFSLWFFVPIYFALVGLSLDTSTHLDVELLLFFLISTSIVKIGCVVFGVVKWCDSWKSALDYGFVMNSRGGPGIVLASVAYAAFIISSEIFIALVLTSILTSMFAGVWLRYRISRDPNAFPDERP